MLSLTTGDNGRIPAAVASVKTETAKTQRLMFLLLFLLLSEEGGVSGWWVAHFRWRWQIEIRITENAED